MKNTVIELYTHAIWNRNYIIQRKRWVIDNRCIIGFRFLKIKNKKIKF